MVRNFLALTAWFLILTGLSNFSLAQPASDDFGQTIQINTSLRSFVGKPQWLLIIRDVDKGQNIPYLYDIETGTNFWVAFTYSRNYMITVSNLQFSPYRRDPWRSKTINNFCHLESNGQIIRGKSIYVTITGDLTPFSNTYSCHVSRYQDANFTIVAPDNAE